MYSLIVVSSRSCRKGYLIAITLFVVSLFFVSSFFVPVGSSEGPGMIKDDGNIVREYAIDNYTTLYTNSLLKNQTLRVHNTPVNFEHGNGNFTKIDNKIEISYNGEKSRKWNYRPKENFYYNRLIAGTGVYFASYSHVSPLVRYETKSSFIEYSPVKPNIKQGFVKDNNMSYPGIYDNVDFSFYCNGNDLKFVAYVSDVDISMFEFEIDIQGELNFTANSVNIGDIMLPPIEVFDRHNNDYRGNYSLKTVKNQLILQIIIPSINAKNYPIRVDPTSTIYASGDTHIREDSANNNYGGSGYIYNRMTATANRFGLHRYPTASLVALGLTREDINSAEWATYMHSTDSSNYFGVFQLHDDNWTEYGAKYNNYDFQNEVVDSSALDYNACVVSTWFNSTISEELGDALDESTNIMFGTALCNNLGEILTSDVSLWCTILDRTHDPGKLPYIAVDYDAPPIWYINNTQYLNSTSKIISGLQINNTGSLIMNGATMKIIDDAANNQNITILGNGSLYLSTSTIKATSDSFGFSVNLSQDCIISFANSFFRCLGNTYFPIFDIQNSLSVIRSSDFYFNGALYLNTYLVFRHTNFSYNDGKNYGDRGIIFNQSSLIHNSLMKRVVVVSAQSAFIGNFTDNSTIFVNSSGWDVFLGNMTLLKCRNGQTFENLTGFNNYLTNTDELGKEYYWNSVPSTGNYYTLTYIANWSVFRGEVVTGLNTVLTKDGYADNTTFIYSLADYGEYILYLYPESLITTLDVPTGQESDEGSPPLNSIYLILLIVIIISVVVYIHRRYD